MASTRPAAAADSLASEQLVTLLSNMLLQRAVDTRGFQLNRQGKIGIAMGSEGHEAVQAGAGMAFERGKDLLYPYYRNTGITLACGFALEDIFRSQFARATDTTGGKSIINHVTDKAKGIATISSILAAQCPHAVGAAYAIKHRGERDRIVLCQFGEGSTSEGEWHESINFAAIHQVPVVFLCENNQWAISTPISKQMANPSVAARAQGYGIEGVVVDGFDPVAVYDAVRRARAKAVAGGGPTIVEAMCYRFLSHTTDDDERTYRTREEVAEQRVNDPVPRFEARLIGLGIITRERIEEMRAAIAARVNAATDAVEREPSPDPKTLYDHVYEGSCEVWI
ncbi:MAG TPA: thiamine pyrophosphate-dependent dehydrogenase E1 component subunit alpha [Candidatus Baltobacteraceae bacterium]|nr:thiamine pyrophosphate-dependent dehydrogenase E1 component subunit alpha [Candidatus Baltobacteraceae bacterium]